MLASQDLQLQCAKHVLQETVYLNSNKAIVSFICFMRRDQRRRWRFLRSLGFGDRRIGPRVAAALGKVISRASHLETLAFEHAEVTLGAHPQLRVGLAAIPTIKHLVLKGISQHACQTLEAMSWPLETAVLEKSMNDDLDWDEEDSSERMHPAALLRNSRATLRSFKYSGWWEDEVRLPEYPVYPALRSLHFADAWLPPTYQWPLTYPNLESMTVCSIDADSDMDSCTDTRLANLQEHAEVGCWPELKHFSGGVLDLYVLGLPCRIRDVDISVSSKSVDSLAPTLANARPSRLAISAWQHELFEGRNTDLELPSYLRTPGMGEVKTLRLEIGAESPVPTVDMDTFLAQTYDALAHVDLHEFILYVKYPGTEDPYSCVDPGTSDSEEGAAVQVRSPSPAPCPMQIWTETVNAQTLAPRAFSTIQTLQAFELILHPPDSIRYQHLLDPIACEDRRTKVHRDKVTAATPK